MEANIIRKHIKKQQPFDWLAILVLASFAIVVVSIVSNDLDKFSQEMDREAAHLQAELSSIQKSK